MQFPAFKIKFMMRSNHSQIFT